MAIDLSTRVDTVQSEDLTKARTISDRSRFIVSVIIGTCVGGLVFVWVLCDLFSGRFQPLRVVPNSNFYDAQAESILHGHLWVNKHILGIEGFEHGHRFFTYFGVLPSLLRIPFLLVDPNLNGELTPLFMFAAWVFIALFSAMLLWRVRVLVRPASSLGGAELFSYGALMAVITGGSVLVLLAASPWVYNEDLIWSVATAVGCLFAILGVLERPSWGRVAATGALLLAANLDRLVTAWACDIGAILLVAWLILRRGGEEARRLAFPLGAAVVVSLAVGCIINWMKFGVPFGLPLKEQVWTALNAHFREFLNHYGGNAYSLKFVPTTLWTYFQPFGIRVQTVFPYITLPAEPPGIIGGVFFDQAYRTASVPASMPILFLLTCWGVVASFFRRVPEKAKLLRIPLIAGAAAFGVSFVWGYMAPRFEADLVPLLILGSAAGIAHLWRVIEARSERSRLEPAPVERAEVRESESEESVSATVRRTHERRLPRLSASAMPTIVVALFVIFGLYSIVANFGIAAPPVQLASDTTQNSGYVAAQQELSNLTGDPLAAYVMRGNRLPVYAPAGQLFVYNGCSATDGGLYLSTGESYKYDPVQKEEHDVWVPVELGTEVVHPFEYTFNGPSGRKSGPVPLVSIGPDTIFIKTTGDAHHLIFGIEGPGMPTTYGPIPKVQVGHSYGVSIQTDPALHFFSIVTLAVGGHYNILGYLPSSGVPVVHSLTSRKGVTPPPITTLATASTGSNMKLCRQVLKDVTH